MFISIFKNPRVLSKRKKIPMNYFERWFALSFTFYASSSFPLYPSLSRILQQHSLDVFDNLPSINSWLSAVSRCVLKIKEKYQKNEEKERARLDFFMLSLFAVGQVLYGQRVTKIVIPHSSVACEEEN